MKNAWILIFLSVSLLCGCKNTDPETSARLDRAEAIVMADADSAQVLLREIDPTMLRTKNDQARYELLTAMARYRLNEYDHPETDSLLSIAIDHFDDKSDDLNLIKSLFLRADFRYHHEEYADAMRDALRANEIAETKDNDDWQARSSDQIATLFASTQNFNEALPYIERAIYHYRAADQETNARFAQCDKAVALEQMNRTDESIQLLDSLISLSQTNKTDSLLLSDCLRFLYPILIDNNRWDEGKDRLISLKELNLSDEFLAPEYCYLARVHIKDGEISEASECLQTAKNMIRSDYDRIVYFNTLIELYRVIGDVEALTQATKDNQSALYSSFRKILKQSTLASSGKYYQDKAIKKANEQNRTKQNTIIIIICLFLIICIVIYISRSRINRQNSEIENKIAETINLSLELEQTRKSLTDVTENLSNQLDETKQSLTDVTNSLSSEIETLFRDQWSTLNQIAYKYFESPEDDLTKILVLNEFKHQLSILQSKKNIKAIEEMVDKYMSGIMTLIRKECPFLKEDDFKLILLNIAGFEPRTICLFLNIKLKAFYNKRLRILQRISEKSSFRLETLTNRLR